MLTAYPVWTGETVGCLVAADDFEGHTLLFAGSSSGVLLSTDAGQTWQPTSPDPVRFVESLAVSTLERFANWTVPGFGPPDPPILGGDDAFSPSPPRIGGSGGPTSVRTSQGETDRTIFAAGPSGLHRSTDHGLTWNRQFSSHTHVLATFTGRHGERCVIAGTEADGALRSADNGVTWDSANPGLLDPTVLTLAVSPLRSGARTVIAGTLSGISISRNEGKAWRPAVVPDGEVTVQCLSISPTWADDRTAFAGTETSGLLRTDDGGSSWRVLPDFAGRNVAAIAWESDVSLGAKIAVACGQEVWESTDIGQSWHQVATVGSDIAALWTGHHNAQPVLLVGLYDRGIVRLT